MLRWLVDVLGIETQSVSHKERLISGLGALAGVFGVIIISQTFVDSVSSVLVIASMGASAVLLFAVPHGALSQPWPVIGGHTLSAIIGVSCALMIKHEVLAASVAVGTAVSCMYYARCIHPPGGATAMAAVIGGQKIHELGFQYVLTPIFLNAVTIVTVAILFNALFEWRRYPAYVNKVKNRNQRKQANSHSVGINAVAHEDFVYALSELDTFIDIEESDLLRIYDLATGRHEKRVAQMPALRANRYYSNGEFGNAWSVRRVLDIKSGSPQTDRTVRYKIVAGLGRRKEGQCSLKEFAAWARYEVFRDEDNWRRVDEPLPGR